MKNNNNEPSICFHVSVILCQMTRDTNSHKNIDFELLDSILQVLKQEMVNVKEKEEFVMNLLVMFSNITYTKQFHDWFLKEETMNFFFILILRNPDVPRSPKIRALLVIFFFIKYFFFFLIKLKI